MAKEVFISYSSADVVAANAVCASIEAAGVSCWIAPRDIVPGGDWSDFIIEAINSCRVFVLILTERSNASPQVKREVERGVHKNVPIIAFRLEDVALTHSMEYFISTSHWLDALSKPLEDHFPPLLNAVQEALSHADAPSTLDFNPNASLGDSHAAFYVEPPGNLPTLATSFMGREAEIAQALELLDADARLVTLTGAGGIGKTRLALKMAEVRKANYPAGIWWVDLAPLQDPGMVLSEIATTLGLQETPGESLRDQIKRFLQHGKTLFVLDNFEQVLSASEDLDSLLIVCPLMTALVTSRAVLNLSLEYEYPVPELGLSESVALFIQRAKQTKANFTADDKTQNLIESLCRKLDGIPLALELAAAQVKMLPVAQIEKQLSQRFRLLVSPYKDVTQRQRTMRATLDWSYNLLSEEEGRLFAQLSIFEGGFSLEEAEAVCEGEDTYFGISRLREQSLLRMEETDDAPRFRMLETVRDYAQDKLRAEGLLDAVAERHALYYAEVARLQGGRLRETGDAEAITLLVTQVDNLRAALDWLWRSERYEVAAEMYVDLGEFWERRGWYREARTYLDQAVRQLDRLADESLRARVLKAAGWIAYLLGDFAEAETLTQRSLDGSIAAALPALRASALNNLALISQSRQHFDRAEELLQQSIALLRTLGNDRVLADRLTNLGLLESKLARPDQARQCLDEARKIYERHSDAKGVAGWLCNQSDLALQQCNWTEAENLAEQSLRRFRQVDDRRGIACALANRAEADSHLGKHEAVDSALNEAYGICADTNLHFLMPTLLLTHARSRVARNLTRHSATAFVASRRLRELLDMPYTPEEEADMAQLESDLRSQDPDNLLGSLHSELAGASLQEIIARLSAPE